MIIPTQRGREHTATTGRNYKGQWYLMVMDHSVDRDDWPRHYWTDVPDAPCLRVRRAALQQLGYEAIGEWLYTEWEDGRSPGLASWGLVVRVRELVPAPIVPADVDDLVDAAELTVEPVPEGAAA